MSSFIISSNVKKLWLNQSFPRHSVIVFLDSGFRRNDGNGGAAKIQATRLPVCVYRFVIIPACPRQEGNSDLIRVSFIFLLTQVHGDHAAGYAQCRLNPRLCLLEDKFGHIGVHADAAGDGKIAFGMSGAGRLDDGGYVFGDMIA